MNSPDAIAAVHKLHIDFETRSLLELNKVGPSKYATHPSTNVLCCAYAVDGEPVKIWMPGDPPPPPVHAAALDPDYWIIVAHNASFEMAIMRHVVSDWPGIPVERFRCTMAKALALALPRKLEKLADALDLLHRKDAAGHRLMLARPSRAGRERARTRHSPIGSTMRNACSGSMRIA